MIVRFFRPTVRSLPYVEGESSHSIIAPVPSSVPVISVSNNLNPSNFSVMYYNARSILPKMDELHVLVRAQNPSIVFIVESWISEDIQDCEISIEDYHIVRLDRNRHGGGIIIYIHVSLN